MSAECGTHAAYQAHIKRGESACAPCKAAAAAYARQRRSTPEGRRESRDLSRAQGRAMRALARLHRAEYQVLYAAALRAIQEQRDEETR